MGISFHNKNDKKYVQYTCRIEECILNDIKKIAVKEDISINEAINQSLLFAVTDYKKIIKNKKGALIDKAPFKMYCLNYDLKFRHFVSKINSTFVINLFIWH